jgi:hypothetical protein
MELRRNRGVEYLRRLTVAEYIKEYDPNIRWARHTFELTFMQWDYSLTIEVDVTGNCKGADLFRSALSTVFEELYDEDDGYSQIVLKRPATDGDESGFDTLEVDLENESDLEAICVGIKIVKHEKEQP